MIVQHVGAAMCFMSTLWPVCEELMWNSTMVNWKSVLFTIGPLDIIGGKGSGASIFDSWIRRCSSIPPSLVPVSHTPELVIGPVCCGSGGCQRREVGWKHPGCPKNLTYQGAAVTWRLRGTRLSPFPGGLDCCGRVRSWLRVPNSSGQRGRKKVYVP